MGALGREDWEKHEHFPGKIGQKRVHFPGEIGQKQQQKQAGKIGQKREHFPGKIGQKGSTLQGRMGENGNIISRKIARLGKNVGSFHTKKCTQTEDSHFECHLI